MYTYSFKQTIKSLFSITLLFICVLQPVYAENAQDNLKITQNIQNLKNEVLELNRDLFVLEEELLFSANTQINVFLSMDAGNLFKLDSVQLKIDDKIVTNYLYTDRELRALQRGGVQRLHIGNMSAGEHEITAILVGEGPNQRDYKRGASQKVEKTDEALYVELKIIDNASKEQPEFEIKVWE
ncbi:MAG TPA: AraC family transcriptional regulator [Gammaproteobacteria bacterium]